MDCADMWRLAIPLTVACLTGVAIGSAASLANAPGSLGAAMVSVPRCTSAGLLVVPNLAGSNWISVTVSNLPAGCGGATIQATIDNGSANQSGSNTVPGGGGSVTITLAAGVAATTNSQIEVLVTGP